MAEVDPETLLEWLQMGSGDERDMQLIALEQLCMLLLMSDNVDRCFESCPPRTFLPALCRIFLDEEAPDQVCRFLDITSPGQILLDHRSFLMCWMILVSNSKVGLTWDQKVPRAGGQPLYCIG